MIKTINLTIRAGDFELPKVNLSIPKGAYCVLMGKTGSGKTTLLEAICGLKEVVSGQILFAGKEVTRHRPSQRGIGFVPQDGALFQTMTVREHLQFATKLRHWKIEDIESRVQQLAQMLEIEPILDRKPFGLSGGERQRVALGRALSFHPQILCLDEPLSALDDETREQMIGLLKRVQKETAVTALHVTHNLNEANALATLRLDLVDRKIHQQSP